MANVGNVYLGVNGQAVDLYSAKKMYVGFNNKAVEIPLGQSKFDYKTWLASASISATGYATLDSVLADEVAVRKLMTIHAAVDYLASWKTTDEDIVKILSNDICAKWITLRDYALDTLDREYRSLMESLGKYYYGEWALMPQVPVMTSNTAPYGEVIYDGTVYYSNYPYYVFDGDGTDTLGNPSSYATTNKTNTYIGYHFTSPVRINKMSLQGHFSNSERCPKNFKVQASNDNSTWVDLYTGWKAQDLKVEYFSFSNNTAYQYYRLFVIDMYDPSHEDIMSITTLQFYAWAPKGNVPIMTSNTAPYGEAFASSNYDTTNFQTYKAFDDVFTTKWIGGSSDATPYIGYKFTNPVCVKRYTASVDFRAFTEANSLVYVFEGSNDNSTWESINSYSVTGIDTSADFNKDFSIDCSNNDKYYLYYRIKLNKSMRPATLNFTAFVSINFYGRELKVSVPTMTSDTAPYGECVGDIGTGADVTNYPRWKAFDGNTSTSWKGGGATNKKVGYKFTGKTCVKKIYILPDYKSSKSLVGNFKLIGSNDGNTWEEIESFVFPNISSGGRWFDVTDTAGYLYNGVLVVDNYPAGNFYINVNELQFYGLDYSEYDWDTENPRHYLYDHGVELETISKVDQSGGNGTLTKEPGQMLIGPASPNGYAIYAEAKIPTSGLSLSRAALGGRKDGTSFVALAANTNATFTGTNAYKSYNNSDASMPNNLYLDISSFAENNSVGLYVANTTAIASITEWWLE